MKSKMLAASLLLACSALAVAGEGFTDLDRATARRLADPASHGAPTVVALWSLECVHCKKNLKAFAELAQTDPRVKLVTVAVEPAQPALAELLDRLRVPGARYAYGSDAPEALAYALDPKWRGELPRTFFFDGRGGRVAVSGVVDPAAVREALGLARK